MKVKLKAMSITVSALISISQISPVSAIEAIYNPDEGSLSVAGNNNSSDIAVAVMPYRYSTDKLSVDIVNSNDAIVFQHLSAGGDYCENILLPLNLPFGKYRVSEIISGTANDTLFYKFSKSLLVDAVSSLNNADKLSDAVSAIESLVLDFDSNVKSKASEIAEFLYNDIPKSGYDTDGFLNSFSLYEGLVSLDREEISLDTFVNEYSAFMNSDVKDNYNELTAELKKAVADIVKDIEFEGKSAADIRSEIAFVSKVKLCDNYDDLKNIVINYCSDNDISLDDYEELSDFYKNSIFIEMFSDRGSFKTSEDVIDGFNKYIDEVEEEKNSGGGSSGGSSGGGGSKSPVSGGAYQVDNSSLPAEQPILTFKDIEGHWAKNEIEKLYASGIINGTGNGIFEPDRYVTRAEFVKMLLGSLGINESDYAVSFEDVSVASWYYKYVSTAVELGFVKGVSETQFTPDNRITREDAATMVYRAVSAKLSSYSDNSFVDSDQISAYALEAVKALADSEILKGSNGYFRPKADITRAEAAALLLRVYNLK